MSVTLRGADDRELGRAEATEPRLALAARKIAFALADAGALPTLPPRAGAWMAGSDDGKLASLAMDPFDDPDIFQDMDALCAPARALDPTLAKTSPAEAAMCDPRAFLKPFPIDHAAPGRLAESLIVDSEVGMHAPASVFDTDIAPALARATDPDDRAMLRVVLAQVKHHGGQYEEGCQLLRAAIADSPSFWLTWYYMPIFCDPTAATMSAMAGWSPDLPKSAAAATPRDEQPGAELSRIRELFAQAPTSPRYQVGLVSVLAATAHVEDAQQLATTLETNARATPFMKSAALAYVQLARGRVKAACSSLRSQLLQLDRLEDAPSDAFWSVLVCADVLGTQEETAAAIITRFDSPAVSGSFRAPAGVLTAALTASPKMAERALADTRGAMSTAYKAGFEARALADARAKRDHAAALAALRELVLSGFASEQDAVILDEIGADDLAGALDERIAERKPTRIAGISSALPRMARRAMRQGRVDDAKALAQKVIDAWSLVDAPLPALAEMRAIRAGTWKWKPAW
jgi:hypothetical protein